MGIVRGKCATLVALLGLLGGCQMAQNAADRISCSADLCTREYPREPLLQRAATLDSLVVLPPRDALFKRDLSGNDRTASLHPGRIDDSARAALERIARAYSLRLSMAALSDQHQAEAAEALHDRLWEAARDPEQVVHETSLFGMPEIHDPVARNVVEVPEALAALVEDACCLLVSRQSGWSDTGSARRAKVATAALFSVLPGGSGAVADGGDVLTDVAVIRIKDGHVLWSAQRLAAGQNGDIAQASKTFFSRVYNDKQMHPVEP